MELEQRRVKTIDEAITQVESLMEFKHEPHDKAKGRDARSSHAKGGADRGGLKEQHNLPKPNSKQFVCQNDMEK